jgi:hypothetical protein
VAGKRAPATNASRHSERPNRQIIHHRPENNVHPANIGQRKGADEKTLNETYVAIRAVGAKPRGSE